jgi:hypothetical protein
MNEQALSDRVLARKRREAKALKANIQRRKEQLRQQDQAMTQPTPVESAEE